MKHAISKVTGTALVVMVFSLSACKGTHESQGKQIGKKIDNFENRVKNKIDEGKETAHKEKENAKKKAHEAHEKSKETAHEIIDKS
jgi:F0F1-type ATP synthase membrane subunit b/b'